MIRSLNGIGNSSSSNITNNVYVNTLENGEAIEIEQVGTTTANKVNLAFKQNTTQASSVANNDLILIADNATGKVVKYVEANLVGQVLTATTPIQINNNVISTTFTNSSTDHLLNKTITSFVGNSLSNINTPASSGTLATTSQFLTNPNFGTASTPIRTTTFGSNSQPTILNGSSIALGGKITNQIIIKGANASASVNSDIQFLENGNTICGNVGFTAGKLQLINNNSTDTLIGTYGSGNYKLEFVSDTKFKSSATNNLNDGNITNLTKINNHTAPPYAFNSGTIALQSDILNGKNFGTTPSSGITTFGADGATTQVKGTSITIETGTGTGNTLQLDGTIVNVDSTTFLNLKGSQITFEPKLGTGSVVFGASANGSYYDIDVKDNIIKNTLTNANGSARPVHFGSDVELTNRTMNCGIVSASGNIFGANVVVDSVSLRDSGGGSGTSPLVLPNLMTDFAGGIISGNPTRRMGGTSSASEIKGSTIKLDSDVVNIGTTNSCVSTFKGSITTTGLINNKNLGTMDTAIATNASAIATINNAGYITASSADTLTNKSISYSQLTSTPTIPTNNTQLSNGAGYITASSTDTLTNKSLSYSQLTSTPTIPSNNTQLTNGAGYITASSSNVLSNKEFSDTPQFRDGEIMIKATSSSTIANPNVDCRVEFTDTDLATIAECGLTGNKFNLKNNIVNQNMDIGCAGTGIIKHLSNTEFKSSGVNNFNSGTITNLTSLNTHTIPSGSGELGLKANIDTNTTAIATNASNISNNASSITSNTSNIATNASNISTNTTNILTNTGNITANTGNISENAGNITSNTANISTLLNAGYITASSTDTLTNKSLSYSQLTGTPTIPNTTTASNFGTSSSSNVIVGSTTKHLELQGTSIDIEDKDGTSIIEITDSDTKFKGTDISIIGRSATISPKMYFTNFTNPFTSYIRLVGQADAGASGTHTLTLPQATGTLALLSDITASNVTASSTTSFTNKSFNDLVVINQANEALTIKGTGAGNANACNISFRDSNNVRKGAIGDGSPSDGDFFVLGDAEDIIIRAISTGKAIRLQTGGATSRMTISDTDITASKKIVASGGIETTSINLNNPAHVDIYTPEIEVSTLTDDNTFIEMRSGTGNSSSTKVSTLKLYNKNNTKSAFIGLDTNNKLHLTNNSFGGNNLKIADNGIDVEALGVSTSSFPISWKSNIQTAKYGYLFNTSLGNGWHTNAVGDQFLCNLSRDIIYYNTDLIGNANGVASYNKLQLGDIFCEDVFAETLNYTGANNVSDARLKKNLKPIENAIETLNKLTPLLYDKKVKDETDLFGTEYTPDSGFIAQDVYNEVPELRFIVNNVAEDIPENFDSSGNLIRDCIGWSIIEDKPATSVPVDSPPDASGNPNPDAGNELTEATYKKVRNPDKKLSINYEELTAYLVKGIQEQDVRIRNLENIITKLTSSASFANFKKII